MKIKWVVNAHYVSRPTEQFYVVRLCVQFPVQTMFLDFNIIENSSFYKIKNILSNIWAIVSQEYETWTLMGKDYAKRLPLSHGVVFILFWVMRGIMELKYHKDWNTLPCFYCNKAFSWRNTRSVKLKMIVSRPDTPLLPHRTSQVENVYFL